MIKRTLFIFCVVYAQAVLAQEVISSLVANPFLKNLRPTSERIGNSMRILAVSDTILLPFVDDFSTSRIVPDTLLWIDRSVYINNNFPINPPSTNVATFDGLDRYGNPYNITGNDPYGFADTLTSKAIDLSSVIGADSVYLSFFIEPQGNGLDSLQSRDSIYVDFYNQFGIWERIWRLNSRGNINVFNQYLIAVKDARFYHAGFRFRFMSRTGLAGNLNQVHLDYVRLDRFRNVNDTLINDIAINGYPRSLLKNYRALPWKQFKNLANPQSEMIDSVYIRVRNLNSIPVQAIYQYKASDYGFNLIAQDSNRLNLKAYDTVMYRLNKFAIPLTTSPDTFFMIRMKYSVNTTFDLNLKNDSLEQLQPFSNYIAYDDGNAEAGYMLSSAGKVAIRFQLQKPDTLKAFQIFFNQSEFDTRNKPCTLAVWSKIGSAETIIRTQVLNQQVFTGVVNGFATIVLDTPQFIDPITFSNLEFYIGWIQGTAYSVNLGLDVHYNQLMSPSAVVNSNLNYNVFGIWSKSLYRAIPMIRPVLGSMVDDPLYVKPVNKIKKDDVKIYPNPVLNQFTIEVNGNGFYRYMVYDFTGKIHLEFTGANHQEINVAAFGTGAYFMRVTDTTSGETAFVQFIKQ